MSTSFPIRAILTVAVLGVLSGAAEVQAQFKKGGGQVPKGFARPGLQNNNGNGGLQQQPPGLRSFSRPGVQNDTGGFQLNGPRPGFQNSPGNGGFGFNQPQTQALPRALEARPGFQNQPQNFDLGFNQPQPQQIAPARPGFQNDTFNNFGFGGNQPQSFAFNNSALIPPSLPAPTRLSTPILIACSREEPAGMNCVLRGGTFSKTYHLNPGQALRINEARNWSIEFHRGGDLGSTKYRLIPGQYTFRGTEKGWELFRSRVN